jgi:hypothetical protein
VLERTAHLRTQARLLGPQKEVQKKNLLRGTDCCVAYDLPSSLLQPVDWRPGCHFLLLLCALQVLKHALREAGGGVRTHHGGRTPVDGSMVDICVCLA